MALCLFGCAVLCACGSGDGSAPKKVTESEYGSKWPLVAHEATIGCDPGNVAYAEVEGKKYALNGNAIRAGLSSVDSVKNESAKSSLFAADFTERAMQICLNGKR